MPTWSGVPALPSVQVTQPRHHRTGVLALATLMLLAGCASQERLRPPLGSLLPGYKYQPLTPPESPETREQRKATRAIEEIRERERVSIKRPDGLALDQEGNARFTGNLKRTSLEVQGPTPVSRPLPPSPVLDAPEATPSPPRIAPEPRPMTPIRLPTSANTPLEMPSVKAPQPIAFPMPFWAQVALLVLLPGTAHAPDHVPDCSRTRSHKNEHLAGKMHPVTGIPYSDNGYPVFESIADVTIPEELRGPE